MASWGRIKKEWRNHALPLLTNDAVVLSFGWNSVGFGSGLGFELEEIMLVSHGGEHNDRSASLKGACREVYSHDTRYLSILPKSLYVGIQQAGKRVCSLCGLSVRKRHKWMIGVGNKGDNRIKGIMPNALSKFKIPDPVRQISRRAAQLGKLSG